VYSAGVGIIVIGLGLLTLAADPAKIATMRGASCIVFTFGILLRVIAYCTPRDIAAYSVNMFLFWTFYPTTLSGRSSGGARSRRSTLTLPLPFEL
jgi:hypothetical protein